MEDVAKKLLSNIPLVGGVIAATITLVVTVRRNNHFMEKIEEANEEILFDLTYAYVLFRLLATATKGNTGELVIAGGATWINRIFKHVTKVKASIEQLYVRPKTGFIGRWQATVNWNSAEHKFREIKDQLNDLKNDLNSMYEEFDIVTRGVNVVFLEDLMKIFKTLSTNPTKLAGIEQQIIQAEKNTIKKLEENPLAIQELEAAVDKEVHAAEQNTDAQSEKITPATTKDILKEQNVQSVKTERDAKAIVEAPMTLLARKDTGRALGFTKQNTKGISDTEKAKEFVKVPPPAPPPAPPPPPKWGFLSNIRGYQQLKGGRRKTRRRRSRKGKTIRRKKQ
jgi:hypothetical protein